MIDLLKTRNWQLETSPWLHSDMKDVAYFYTHRLIKELVKQGGLK